MGSRTRRPIAEKAIATPSGPNGNPIMKEASVRTAGYRSHAENIFASPLAGEQPIGGGFERKVNGGTCETDKNSAHLRPLVSKQYESDRRRESKEQAREKERADSRSLRKGAERLSDNAVDDCKRRTKSERRLPQWEGGIVPSVERPGLLSPGIKTDRIRAVNRPIRRLSHPLAEVNRKFPAV